MVSIHDECVFVMTVVNSIHAECFFALLNSKKRQSSATVYILHIYTWVMHVYIFSPFSPTVTYMHKYTFAFFIPLFITYVYTHTVHKCIFANFSDRYLFYLCILCQWRVIIIKNI